MKGLLAFVRLAAIAASDCLVRITEIQNERAYVIKMFEVTHRFPRDFLSKAFMFVGARSLPTGRPRFAGEHGPRTASYWQADSELAWFALELFFVLHLARCSGLHG